MPRRTFVRRLPVVTAGMAAGLTSLSTAACGGVPHLAGRPHPSGLVLNPDEVPDGGGAFVQRPGSQRPLFVSRTEDGWVAVEAACTHRGCQPEPVANRLVCPCHGSEFSFTGRVLSGPAERPLPSWPVEEAGTELIIRTAGGSR